MRLETNILYGISTNAFQIVVHPQQYLQTNIIKLKQNWSLKARKKMKCSKEREENKSLQNVKNGFKIESTRKFLGDDSNY